MTDASCCTAIAVPHACCVAVFSCSLTSPPAVYRARIGAACRRPCLPGGGRLLLGSQGLYPTPMEFQFGYPALQLLQRSSRYDKATCTAASFVQDTLMFTERQGSLS